MAHLELTTTELAKTITAYFDGEISNIKGLSNGISFDVELGIKLLPKSIPIKIVFSEFDENGIIIFEILLNTESKIMKKGFGLIVKSLGKLLNDDFVPEGVELEDNYLYITLNEMVQQPGIEIFVTDAKVKSKKVQIEFDIKND